MINKNDKNTISSLSKEELLKYIDELETNQSNLKLQNAELLESVANFIDIKEFYNLSIIGHIVLDRNSNIVSTNLSGAAMLGLETQELTNTPFYDYIPTESKSSFLNFTEDICTGKKCQDLEIRLVHNDGKTVFIKIKGFESKRKGHYQITLSDISEQKLRVEEIVKTRQHQLKLIENASYGVALMENINGKLYITYSSAAGHKLFGYNPEHYTENPFSALHPDDAEYIDYHMKRMLNDKTYIPILKYRFQTINGEYRWIESTITNLIEDPTVNAIVINFRDLTEQKIAEKALLESEKLYRILVENSNEGIVLHKDGNFLYANPKMIAQTGYDREELVSKPFMEFIIPEDRERALNYHMRCFSGDTSVPRCQFRSYKKDKSLGWFEISGLVIEWEGDKASLSFINDITERKLIELEKEKHLQSIIAKNRISKTIITHDDPVEILVLANCIIFETFKLDMSTVFYVSFVDKKINIINSWQNQMNQNKPEYLIKETAFDDFSDALMEIKLKHQYLESYADKLNSGFNFDTSLRDILHEQSGIKSLLWYPLFIDNEGGYYIFNLNLLEEERSWTGFELELMESITKELSLVLTKNRLIEESKRATIALTESEQRYRSIFENVQDVFFTIHLEGEIIDISPSIKYFTDYNRGELIGSSVLDLYENLDDSIVFLTELKSKGEINDFEMKLKTKNNNFKYVSVNARLIIDDMGKAIHIDGALRDISRRKIAEDELKNSLEQLQHLTQYIQNVREEERLSISRELHDDIGQSLTALKMDLSNLKSKVTDKSLVLYIEKLMQVVNDTIKSVQSMTSNLRPSIIDDLGIEDAIEWYTNEWSIRNGIKMKRSLGLKQNIDPEKSLQIFRIMQESLTNVVRHSNATEVTLVLSHVSTNILLKITDNGIGITDNEINAKNSYGIMSMKERASNLNGTYEIGRGKKRGTFIKLIIPN